MISKEVYLHNEMKIGIIGISGKGKTTLLNHLIDETVADKLKGLIAPKNKEELTSGQTKNPVRYLISQNLHNCYCTVSRWDDKLEKAMDDMIGFEKVIEYARSTQKCTVSIGVNPSKEFSNVMKQYGLEELEFIDTQGLLDTLDSETQLPFEIRECSLLLYLYDETDPASARGDYIKRYRGFLNSISDKPLIFLETSTQWQITKKQLENIESSANEYLEELDENYVINENSIRSRYSILTGNSAYKNNDTFILTSVLSESKSSVNFYEVKLSSQYIQYTDYCLRICAAHTLREVFSRLAGLKDAVKREFDKVNSRYKHKLGFSSCYDLLWDVFVMEWQRIDSSTSAKVLRSGRHQNTRFKNALKAFNEGKLFKEKFTKKKYEIHTQYGYHCLYETYDNQDLLDCMQLFLDLYNSYLQNLEIDGTKLSKAIQVYLIQSVSSDRMCRNTGYEIPILQENVFIECMRKLEKWCEGYTVDYVVYKDYEKFDVARPDLSGINRKVSQYNISLKSLITKLDYVCMTINDKMYNKATDSIMKIVGK